MKKLCNNDTSSRKGEERYDPSYKFDLIYKVSYILTLILKWHFLIHYFYLQVIVHNINALTKSVNLDLCGDASTWATASPGESGSGITGRVQGKPGVSKGGQTVLLSDMGRI